MRRIRGAGGGKTGGGGGSARAPVEAPDSLRSKQFARVLDLLSEGEIVGLVNGNQSIFLDDTPLQNGDGTYNFQGVTVATVNGSQAQAYIPGFAVAEAEVPVGVEVNVGVPVTRTIAGVNVNKVRVTIGVPQLTQQNTTTGDLNGYAVGYSIQLQSNGGGFVTAVFDTMSGKTTTRYQRAFEISLTGSPPWDIRIVRSSPDDASAVFQSRTFWDSYTEIIEAKLAYPNSALSGIEIDASQFNVMPRRGFEIKGIKVQIPSNYDPLTRIYTGVWNGTFTTAWTDNPAWCLYDLVTNARYGLGAFVAATQVDKWSLYSIAQYCDVLVPNGFGGMEPRFTCNLYLQTRAEAFKVVTSMASIFRGMAYWSAGTVTTVADKPADAVAMFAMANVIDGAFSYQGTAKNTRHSVALVTWNDPADAYRQKIEYVEDLAGIERYGVVQTEVIAFGCTSRGQAHRLGKWLLYSERLQTETCSFRTGFDGVLVAPGNVIKTQDAARAGQRFGGRVVSGTTTVVTIDAPVTIQSGKTYTLSIITPAGAISTSPVTNSPGSTSTITCSPALAAAPQVNALWVLAANDLVPEEWRVLAVTEVDKTQLEIVALKHDSSKYDAVELNLLLEPAPASIITTVPAAPTNLTVTESLFQSGPGIVTNRVTVSWTGNTGRYAVSYVSQFGNWVSLPEMISQTIDIDGLSPDVYTFTVRQSNALGTQGPPSTLVAEVYGKTAPPVDVSGFSIIKVSGIGKAQWTQHPDLDVSVGGGLIVIRHSPLLTGATWQDGIILQEFPGNRVEGDVPLISGTYMAKALDSSGNYSENMTGFVATEGMITGFVTVATTTQHPTFPGVKTNTAVDGVVLTLAGGTLIDSVVTLIDTWPTFDAPGGISGTGTYQFDTYVDLTTVATRRFEADIVAFSLDTGDLIDARLNSIDAWGNFDGTAVDDCDATLFASITNDDPAGSPTWGPYTPFFVSDFTCRAARFRLDLASGDPQHNIQISQLAIDIKIPA